MKQSARDLSGNSLTIPAPIFERIRFWWTLKRISSKEKKRNGKRTTTKTRTKGRRRRRRKNRALSRVFCLFGAKSIHTSTFQKQNIKKNSHHILYICIFFYFTLKIDYNAISLDHYIHLVSRTLTYRWIKKSPFLGLRINQAFGKVNESTTDRTEIQSNRN